MGCLFVVPGPSATLGGKGPKRPKLLFPAICRGFWTFLAPGACILLFYLDQQAPWNSSVADHLQHSCKCRGAIGKIAASSRTPRNTGAPLEPSCLVKILISWSPIPKPNTWAVHDTICCSAVPPQFTWTP